MSIASGLGYKTADLSNKCTQMGSTPSISITTAVVITEIDVLLSSFFENQFKPTMYVPKCTSPFAKLKIILVKDNFNWPHITVISLTFLNLFSRLFANLWNIVVVSVNMAGRGQLMKHSVAINK